MCVTFCAQSLGIITPNFSRSAATELQIELEAYCCQLNKRRRLLRSLCQLKPGPNVIINVVLCLVKNSHRICSIQYDCIVSLLISYAMLKFAKIFQHYFILLIFNNFSIFRYVHFSIKIFKIFCQKRFVTSLRLNCFLTNVEFYFFLTQCNFKCFNFDDSQHL